ncbi:MAG: TspO/MBR family protein, partial [Cyanophyceae cyanobacterium]
MENFIKSWMVIGVVTLAIASLSSLIQPQGVRWFNRQRRPRWLTFERLIPLFWSLIFVAGALSANEVWETEPGTGGTWLRMGGYILLELLIVSYVPIMFWLRSLQVGTIIGWTGWVWGVILSLWVAPVS